MGIQNKAAKKIEIIDFLSTEENFTHFHFLFCRAMVENVFLFYIFFFSMSKHIFALSILFPPAGFPHRSTRNVFFLLRLPTQF